MMERYTIRRVRMEDLEEAAQVELLCFPIAEAATRESLRLRIQTFPESFLVAVTEPEEEKEDRKKEGQSDKNNDRNNNRNNDQGAGGLGGTIIGFINGCVTNDKVICDEMFEDTSYHVPDGDYQAIFGLDVIPDYRRRGVAADLMRHLIEDARKKGRKGLILTCKDGLIHYYEKFGYRNMGLSASVHGGAVWNDMILEFDS